MANRKQTDSSPERPEGDFTLHEALSRKGPAAAEEPPRTSGEALSSPAPAPAESAMARPISLWGPNNMERAIFCRQFATLTQVGIPVLRALRMLAQRTSHGKLRAAIEEAALGVEQGEPIHQAMARRERVFTPLVVGIVRVGGMGGILESSLQRLADIMESKARIRRQVRSAAMYPLVALTVAFAVVMLIMVKAIPVFAEVYNQSEAELPDATKLIMAMSEFLVVAWPLLVVGLIGGIIGLGAWGRTASGRRAFSWIALRTPILSGITRKITVARSCRTLGGLASAGIPLIEAIRLTGDTSENTLVADAWAQVATAIERGDRMSEPLARARIFPPLVVDMIAVGEETGTLDSMLGKIADTYDEEVDATLSGLASIVEPVLIVLLGGIVMFIAAAVLLPYFNMAKIVG